MMRNIGNFCLHCLSEILHNDCKCKPKIMKELRKTLSLVWKWSAVPIVEWSQTHYFEEQITWAKTSPRALNYTKEVRNWDRLKSWNRLMLELPRTW